MDRFPLEPSDAHSDSSVPSPGNLSLSDILEHLLLQEYEDAWAQDSPPSADQDEAWVVSGTCTIATGTGPDDDDF
jgi:hypothetical protein